MLLKTRILIKYSTRPSSSTYSSTHMCIIYRCCWTVNILLLMQCIRYLKKKYAALKISKCESHSFQISFNNININWKASLVHSPVLEQVDVVFASPVLAKSRARKPPVTFKTYTFACTGKYPTNKKYKANYFSCTSTGSAKCSPGFIFPKPHVP